MNAETDYGPNAGPNSTPMRAPVYAAGVLPVSRLDGKVVFLVGLDARDRTWSDFGGKCERIDRGDAAATAAREFYEETCGCVISQLAMRRRLGHGTSVALRGNTQNGHPYWMYVAEVPFQPHLRNAFHKVVEFLRGKLSCRAFVEKIDVQWVTWDQLRVVPKRPVFEATIRTHARVLERISAGDLMKDILPDKNRQGLLRG